jgi:DNA-binding MarR family transcriptional regulator
MVDRLEAHGMLERRADASDRRIWRLHMLPAAEPILKKMAVMGEALGAFVSQGVAPSVRDAMVEGLTQMKMNLTQRTESMVPDSTGQAGAVREVV